MPLTTFQTDHTPDLEQEQEQEQEQHKPLTATLEAQSWNFG
jgi:hypothetical protein